MPYKDSEKRRQHNKLYARQYRRDHPWEASQYMRRWRLRKTEEQRRAMAERSRAYIAAIRATALEVYSHGTMTCLGCGFDNVDALCIDHIENNGKVHRKETGGGPGFWLWLKRNHYPTGFQVLCHNCNFLKEVARRRATAPLTGALVTEVFP